MYCQWNSKHFYMLFLGKPLNLQINGLQSSLGEVFFENCIYIWKKTSFSTDYYKVAYERCFLMLQLLLTDSYI